MARYLETSERANNDMLKTRWYRNSYNQVKEAVKKTALIFDFTITSENDSFGELVLKNKDFYVTVKIYQITPIETCADLFVECLSFFTFNKGKKFITLFYEKLGKYLTFKGLALHP